MSPRRLPSIAEEATSSQLDTGTASGVYVSPRRLEERLDDFFRVVLAGTSSTAGAAGRVDTGVWTENRIYGLSYGDSAPFDIEPSGMVTDGDNLYIGRDHSGNLGGIHRIPLNDDLTLGTSVEVASGFDVSAIAKHQGTIYYWKSGTTTDGLYSLDTSDDSVTRIGSGDVDGIGGMSSDGTTLYGVGTLGSLIGDIVSINTSDGTVTVIATPTRISDVGDRFRALLVRGTDFLVSARSSSFSGTTHGYLVHWNSSDWTTPRIVQQFTGRWVSGLTFRDT